MFAIYFCFGDALTTKDIPYGVNIEFTDIFNRPIIDVPIN